MARLPTVYRESPEVITSVDFIDKFTGQAFLNLYMAGLAASGAIYTQVLTNDSTFQSDESNHKTDTSGSFDKDFDVEMNRTLIIGGTTAYVILFLAAGSGNTRYVECTLKHVDKDSNETTLATGSTNAFTGAVGDLNFVRTIPLSVSRTTFKKGEILRLTVVNKSSWDGNNDKLYYDPASLFSPSNVDGDITYPTSSRIVMPIEVPD